MSFSSRVRSARKAAKLTQTQLAARTPITQAGISAIEAKNAESSRFIFEIAYALNVNPHWLQTGEGSPDSAPDWMLSTLFSDRITPGMMAALQKDTECASDLTRRTVKTLTSIVNAAPTKPEPDAQVDEPTTTGKLRALYRKRIRHCDHKIIYLMAEKERLEEDPRPTSAYQRTIVELEATNTERQCYQEAEENIALIAEEQRK